MWSQFVPLRDRDQHIIAALSIAIDVTERRRGEEELRKKSERLSLISEAAGELLSDQSPETTVRELFARLAEQVGLDVCFASTSTTQGHACVWIPTPVFRRREHNESDG